MENKNVSGLSVQLLFLKRHLSWFSRVSVSLPRYIAGCSPGCPGVE